MLIVAATARLSGTSVHGPPCTSENVHTTILSSALLLLSACMRPPPMISVFPTRAVFESLLLHAPRFP